MTRAGARDHGGNLDAARHRWGGAPSDWVDLSTGINPIPYPLGDLDPADWTRLPDQRAQDTLIAAARAFWQVPEGAAVLAAPGASALIARMPHALGVDRVQITGPTYNEHAAALRAHGVQVTDAPCPVRIVVHPNNPDGRFWTAEPQDQVVIDESFCDIAPGRSHMARAVEPGTVILKSFGKFWGLAGLRLGFAIGDPALINKLAEGLGPWPVAGPALRIGAQALSDTAWADAARERLARDSSALDQVATHAGWRVLGGTTLFRLYETPDADAAQEQLARGRVWSRVFPYSQTWLRLGLPGSADQLAQVAQALDVG